MAQSTDPQPKALDLVLPRESLEDLAAKQGVAPVHDLDALAARWPADDDPDALDAFVQNQRAARRSVTRRAP